MESARLLFFRLLSAYVRRVTPHRGHWRLANLAVKLSPLLKSAKQPTVVTLHEGFRLIVDGRSQTGRIAYATGRYEQRTTDLLKAIVQSGDTVIDVGANIGYFAIVASRAVGPPGCVHAFEPVDDVRDALIENLRLNTVTQVAVHREALSDDTGDITFYRGPAEDSGLSSLRELSGGASIRVSQVRFDDWWQRRGRVALVKIDVEGAELRVLQGMSECLIRDRPDLLLEVTDAYLRALGASAEQMLSFLQRRGYQMWQIPESGRLIQIRSAEELAICPSQFNALCTCRNIQPWL